MNDFIRHYEITYFIAKNNQRTSDPGSYLTLNKSERAPNGSEKYVKEKRTVKNAVSHMYASM